MGIPLKRVTQPPRHYAWGWDYRQDEEDVQAGSYYYDGARIIMLESEEMKCGDSVGWVEDALWLSCNSK